MDPKLVYDVGVHRVVGVEANPAMAGHLRDRFKSEIGTGALQLLEVGVAEIEGELDFWVCDAVSEWSSFQERKASAGGKTSHPVKVRTLPFARILGQHGVPFYCKIDIEGNDHLCLEGIDAADKPRYVSVEMSLAKGDRDLSLLQALGYRKFKIISQVTFGPARSALQVALSYAPGRIRRREAHEREVAPQAVVERAAVGEPCVRRTAAGDARRHVAVDLVRRRRRVGEHDRRSNVADAEGDARDVELPPRVVEEIRARLGARAVAFRPGRLDRLVRGVAADAVGEAARDRGVALRRRPALRFVRRE